MAAPKYEEKRNFKCNKIQNGPRGWESWIGGVKMNLGVMALLLSSNLKLFWPGGATMKMQSERAKTMGLSEPSPNTSQSNGMDWPGQSQQVWIAQNTRSTSMANLTSLYRTSTVGHRTDRRSRRRLPSKSKLGLPKCSSTRALSESLVNFTKLDL